MADGCSRASSRSATRPSLADLDPIYKQLLDDPVTAVVSVTGGDGRSNLTPVWFDYEDEKVLLNLATHRKKVDWLRKNPQLTFLLMNPANAYHWLSIKCTVAREISEDDPERGPAGHRPAEQDLHQVHRQHRALRAARPVHRRAPGPVRAGRGPDRDLREAVTLRVAVVGGSLGGLTAALVLADAGCDVVVHERSPTTLEARGAGIAVLDETVRWFAEKTALPPDELCSSTEHIRFLDPAGDVLHDRRHRYRFSSWNTIYRALLAGFPAERYRLDHEVTGLRPGTDTVELALRDGTTAAADLVVAADGISSTTRAALLPEVAPCYSGYVAWRGTMPESELAPSTFAALADAITYQVLPDSHVLAYPIPGPDGALEPGRRLMNFVWYRNVAAGESLRPAADRPRRPGPAGVAAAGRRPGRGRRPAAGRRQGAAGAGARRGGDRRRGAVRAGGVRHRGAAHGVRPGLPDR